MITTRAHHLTISMLKLTDLKYETCPSLNAIQEYRRSVGDTEEIPSECQRVSVKEKSRIAK